MSYGPIRFHPGETVHLRHQQRGQLGSIFPLRAVRHDDTGLLLWAPAGTQGHQFDMPDGRRMDRTPLPEWSATPRLPVPHRIDHGLLTWHPTGTDYSIRWFFHADGRFDRWYANLEAPAIAWRDDRTAGLDTVDWDLDVVVRPGRGWELKDADLFADRLTHPGSYWVDDADRVRRAARTVIDLAEAGGFPFDGTWCDFRPDPAWPPLPRDLPAGWDRPLSRWPRTADAP